MTGWFLTSSGDTDLKALIYMDSLSVQYKLMGIQRWELQGEFKLEVDCGFDIHQPKQGCSREGWWFKPTLFSMVLPQNTALQIQVGFKYTLPPFFYPYLFLGGFGQPDVHCHHNMIYPFFYMRCFLSLKRREFLALIRDKEQVVGIVGEPWI